MSIQILTTLAETTIVERARFTAGYITSAGFQTNLNKNQDSAGIIDHPKNSDLIMMLVADGISKSKDGDLASRVLVEDLGAWFKHMPIGEINSPMTLERQLTNALRDINKRFHTSNWAKAESGLAGMIIGRDTTLAFVNGSCKLVLADKFGQIVDTIESNEANIGADSAETKPLFPDIKICGNFDYGSAVLATHGVTDQVQTDKLARYANGLEVAGSMTMILTDAYAPAYEELISTGCPQETPNATALVYTRNHR